MKTVATAQLSAHQSAGDVIGSVNGAGVMCCGRSMAQRSASQTSPPPLSSPLPPSEVLASCFLTCWWLKNNADCAERKALIVSVCVKIVDVYTDFFYEYLQICKSSWNTKDVSKCLKTAIPLFHIKWCTLHNSHAVHFFLCIDINTYNSCLKYEHI